jgi:uncharacterized protein
MLRQLIMKTPIINLTRLLSIGFSFCFCMTLNGQIIDVHMHSYTDKDYWGGKELNGVASPKNADLHLSQTVAQMNANRIQLAVVCGSLNSIEKYALADPRFIPGYSDEEELIPLSEFELLIKQGKIKVFGEIGAAYYGRTLNDPVYEPYLKICELYDIPVAYHTGGGPPMTPFGCCPKFRLSLGDPLLVEDVLVRHPKLRVYLMHAGENFFENTVRMMKMYERMYVDVGVLLWVDPFVSDYGVRFLKLAKQAGVLNRVMFGSDQMVWPGAITKSIQFLNALEFLSEQEKRMILYENAKSFLLIK